MERRAPRGRESSRRLVARLAAVALGCALGGAALWLVARLREAAETARYEDEKRLAHELVREHALEPRDTRPRAETSRESAPNPGSSAASDAASISRASMDPRSPEDRDFYLTPEVANRLFPRDSLETYDPWSYYRHKVSKRVHVGWPEHPAGSWTWATNSIGLREDREIGVTPPNLRVIVTGDSHTDGLCENSESFPHVAEADLTRRQDGRRIEVLNAANGGFSFYNYLGVLARFVGYSPDAFVVAVYAGNDFVDLLVPHAYFSHTTMPEETSEQQAVVARGKAVSGPAMLQSFYSVIYFRQHPEAFETSVAAAADVAAEIRAICAAHSIHLLFLVIPSAQQLPWGENADKFERIASAASLSKEDLLLTDRLVDSFLERLRATDIETMDVRELLRGEGGPLYWKKDLHLNVRGHALIGHALARRIESWGGKFAR
jgi:hypothetical protein